MKSINNLLIFTLIFVIALSGCKKGGDPAPVVVPDTTKPTITITAPTAGQAFTVGSTIAFQASFSDNVQLNTYDITITKAVTSGMILKVVPTPVAWNYSKPATSLGAGVKQQNITLNDIVIPTLINTNPVATGKYNFKVTCSDSSGNSSETILEININ